MVSVFEKVARGLRLFAPSVRFSVLCKFSPVSFDRILITSILNFGWQLKPVPTAVPPSESSFRLVEFSSIPFLARVMAALYASNS